MKKALYTTLAVVVGLSTSVSLHAIESTIETSYMLQDKDGKKKPPKSKKVEAMLPETGKAITKVVELYELKDYQAAMAELDKLKKRHDRGKLKGVGSATMFQFLGTIYYELEQPKKTIEMYEEFLKYKDSVNEGTYLQVLFQVGQLKFAEALDMPEGTARTRAIKDVQSIFLRWEREATVISVANYFFIAQVFLLSEDFKTTLAYMDKVIASASEANLEPQENWYRTRLQAYYSLEEYGNVIDTLLTLINSWPKPSYWRQLAGAFSQNGQEKEFFSVTEINYESGFFERAGDYTNMAQIFMANEVPIKAAWVMEQGIKDQVVEKDEQTYTLLGSAYIRASEYDKAIEPISKAAELNEDWKLWMQVGQMQQSTANYAGAEKAYNEALKIVPEKNDKDRFTLLTLLGNALTEQKRFSEAKKSFDNARKLAASSTQRRQMSNWDKYLTNEKTRWEMLQ